jgi:hypothetical protein
MKTGILRIVWSAALIVMLGCATSPGTGESPPSLDDLAATAVDELVGAYEDRDVSGFMAMISARYLEGYEDLQATLQDTLETVLSVQLEIDPQRVWEAEGDKVFVDAGWSKTITRSTPPGTETTSGRVTFIFIRYTSEVLKLLSQKGDPVFP